MIGGIETYRCNGLDRRVVAVGKVLEVYSQNRCCPCEIAANNVELLLWRHIYT
jgi:hypothetical protein